MNLGLEEEDGGRRMVKTIVGVMGPGTGATPGDCELAFRLGQRIAEEGWVLLTGGRGEGVMEAASRGAKDVGGLVIGVLPGGDRTTALNTMSEAVDIPIITGMGQARNVINVLSSSIVVACGMGLGTASEVALALKSGVPVIFLSEDDMAYQFFQKLVPNASGVPVGDRPLHRVTTPEEAIATIDTVYPTIKTKN